MLNDIEEEAGGALQNIGANESVDITFAKNRPSDGGLGVQNIESSQNIETSFVVRNVTFNRNVLSSSLQTYSDTQKMSKGSTRRRSFGPFRKMCSW